MKDTTNLDKVSWNRLYTKMQAVVKEVNDIEDQIMDLQLDKMSRMDIISHYKSELNQTCIHPEEWQTHDPNDSNIINCRFCGKQIRNIDNDKDAS